MERYTVSLAEKIVSCSSRTLTSLYETDQILSAPGHLKSALHRVLEILELHSGVIRSFIALMHGHELHIEASRGLTKEGRNAVFQVGEGITGRVVESGKPVVVPKVNSEPLLLHRTGPRTLDNPREFTFICVPIVINEERAGALSMELPFIRDRDYEEAVLSFGLHGSLIARAIAISRLVAGEKRLTGAIAHS